MISDALKLATLAATAWLVWLATPGDADAATRYANAPATALETTVAWIFIAFGIVSVLSILLTRKRRNAK